MLSFERTVYYFPDNKSILEVQWPKYVNREYFQNVLKSRFVIARVIQLNLVNLI